MQINSNSTRRGIDIGSGRIDPLDLKAVAYAVHLMTKGGKACAIDVGCGKASEGIRLAVLGADVHLYDLKDSVSEAIAALKMVYDNLSLTLSIGDIREVITEALPPSIDIFFSQRTIHYLKYHEAKTFIKLVSSRMPIGARAFISVSGITSELGYGYADAEKEVSKRFCHLSPPIANKHRILESVCLYSSDDLKNLFIGEGFCCEEIWLSPFGNVKGIFVREETAS